MKVLLMLMDGMRPDAITSVSEAQAMEAKLEAIFRRYELPFTRTDAYVESERMFQITYSLEVLITDES
mgnify:CR=1 FL=1